MDHLNQHVMLRQLSRPEREDPAGSCRISRPWAGLSKSAVRDGSDLIYHPLLGSLLLGYN